MTDSLNSKPLVVIVADELLIPSWLSKTLLSLGYSIFYLDLPELILKIVEDKSPELIVLDHDYIGSEITNICDQVQLNPSAVDAQVVVIGTNPADTLLRDLFSTGIHDYLEKDLSHVNLEHRVKNFTSAYRNKTHLKHMVYHDALTGLPNRLLLIDRIEHAVARAERQNKMSALLLLDLDNFKLVNDTLGHDFGDELLAEVAMRLTGQVSGLDTVARLGGDEFIILLESIETPADAAVIALGINEILTVPFNINGEDLHITASIGIALSPSDGRSIGRLMKYADAAMYNAKEEGKNRFCFYQVDMAKHISDKLSLSNDLHHALNNNEFVVYYQPQVEAATGRITGMEALVRWQHPERGLVSPASFLPLAEDNGLIVPISDCVLEQACKQVSEWRNSGLDVPHVAVNISTKHFYNIDIIARVKELLSRYGLAGQDLMLEITETTAMTSPEEITPILNELKKLGVGIAIDDFGTGHSSLAYLKRFPIDTLKIDRAFIMDLTTDSDDEKLVKGILSLGKVFSMNVVAEGVETIEQATLLLNYDCTTIQGYLFSKPVDAGFMGELLKLGRLLPEQSQLRATPLKLGLVT